MSAITPSTTRIAIALGLTALLTAPAVAAPPRKPAPPSPNPKSKIQNPKSVVPNPKSGHPRQRVIRNPKSEIESLILEPKSATLTGPRARQRFLVTATLKDGTTLDVTDRAVFKTTSAKVARIAAGGIAAPVADGETQVTASLGARTAPPATLTVQEAAGEAAISFVNDVMPVLSKQGCNASICHGSPAGKGGLKLSLFGYEPDLDHTALTGGSGSNSNSNSNSKAEQPPSSSSTTSSSATPQPSRVNLKHPEKSLLLLKPSTGVPHQGGLRFKKGSPEYNTLLAWIRAGAPGLGELEARVRTIEALPDERLLPNPGATQRLVITATLSDGTTQDVTGQALFDTNEESIATVSPQGVITAKHPGETAIMVRHLGQVAICRVAVLAPERVSQWPQLPTAALKGARYIDEAVFAKLRKLGVLPSDLCSDEEFLRRATLDVIGQVPTVAETRAFLAECEAERKNGPARTAVDSDSSSTPPHPHTGVPPPAERAPAPPVRGLGLTPSAAARQRLIESLLARPEFADVWTLKWSDLLRNNPRLTRGGVSAYHKWIREQVEKNVPYDQWVKALLTAVGQQDEVGSVNYFMVSRDPLDLTSATSQVFMGVRIECARCHNHPFEKYTQGDYYGLAAFFTGIRRIGNGNMVPAQVVSLPAQPIGPLGRRPRRGVFQVRHPKTNQPVEPKVLDETEIKVEEPDGRAAFADWLVSPNNPFFARAIANRIWGHFTGRGIVDPVDDFRSTNPPANPELLDALAKAVVEHKFDLKALMRDILNSRVYQLSSRANKYNQSDTRNFARAYPRRLTAEQLFDSISVACDAVTPLVPPRRPNAPAAGNVIAQAIRDSLDENTTRAHQIPIPRAPGEVGVFLDAFGRPRREVVCECERSADGSVTQALVLINGELINRKIQFPIGRVRMLIRSGKPDEEVIEELTLATLSRKPAPEELREARALIRSGKTREEGIYDVMWGLLNTREFLFNH